MCSSRDRKWLTVYKHAIAYYARESLQVRHHLHVLVIVLLALDLGLSLIRYLSGCIYAVAKMVFVSTMVLITPYFIEIH